MRFGRQLPTIASVVGLTLLLLVAGLASQVAVAADSEVLTVTVFGGAAEEIFRTTLVEPFEKKYNVKVQVVVGLTMDNLAKLRAGKNNPVIDVVVFDPPGAVPAAREGLLEPLDPQRIPNLNDIYDGLVPKHRLYAPFLMDHQVLAYNTKMIKEPPNSWADFWKPEHKGKVLLPDISTSHGAYLVSLMGQTYGKGVFDTDAAFNKLKTLRPNVVTFYTSHDQAAQLLIQGEAWLTSWTNNRAIGQQKAGAPIARVVPKEGAVLWTAMIAIAKGTKHKALAEKYVDYVLSEEGQKAFNTGNLTGSPNRNVQFTGEFAKMVPSREDMRKFVVPDWDRFMDIQSAWADRWAREIR